MKAAIALPPYLPDQTANSGVSLEQNNVYARPDGVGPIGAFQEISDTLPAAFKGGASFIATDGSSYLLAGTANGLARYSNGAWTDLIVGMSVTGQWRFAQFGNFVVGVNGQDTKVVDLSAGTASSLADAPDGKCIAIVQDYVVIGQDTGDLTGIYTSGFNDHTKWNPATTDATVQPMLAGGEVMGLGGGEYGVILQRERIVRMNYTGDGTAPFAYDPIVENVGCASKASVVFYGRTGFFLSDNGFMAIDDGQTLRPIGSEKVDRTFKDEVPNDQLENLFAAIDPQRKVVIWGVPGTPGKLWMYNYELDRWTTATLNIEGLFSGFTSSTDLDALDGDYPNLDAMTVSLEDPRFAGGAPQFYAVQGNKVGSLSGLPLKATMKTGFGEFAKGRIARIRAIRPVTDCIEGQTVTLEMSDRQGDVPVVRVAGALRASGVMPVRARGRYCKLDWEIAAGSDWEYAQALELEFEAGGER